MTAVAAKATLHKLIEDIEDEHTLGEAYLALQEVLHPELVENYDAAAFEAEVEERLKNSLQGETLSNDEMENWINDLFKA
jgi:hypothetical protein